MNIETDYSALWTKMVNVWMEWLVWLFTPGIPNRLVLVGVLVFILCYVIMWAGKFGKGEALTEPGTN